MAYPTVPDLVPFEPDMRPNLLLIGLYDQQLTAIEDYLKKLGAYVDAQDAKLAERITALEGDVADLKRRISAAEATIADHTERIEAIEAYIEALPKQNPDGDAIVTAGEISHVSDTAGTDGPGLFKTSDGWVYVGTPTT